MKKIRILSIDGGGIRGIVPGIILSYIETQLKEKTGDPKASVGAYFDFIAGTSTGGILSLLYVCPDKNGNFKYGAKDALGIYLDLGDDIFELSLMKQIQSVGGITDEKYSEVELEHALDLFLGNTTLGKALRPCLITSYDIGNRKSFFFSSINAKDEVCDFLMRDVGRATSAAPTFFEAARIKSVFGGPYALVDGGVFANNPSLCAYAEARTINFSEVLKNPEKPDKPSAKNMLIVSIGTGSVKRPYTYDEFKDAGMVKWIRPLIDIMMSGNAETVDYQLKKIFETLPKKHCQDYYRIQPKLINSNPEMDKADKENIIALQEDGFLAVADNKILLDEIVDKLIANE
ncbi:patatin-like phospholipase family protein [Hwangdonia sp.]|uniref:patatin-like phospholipase family protein n=1 Tax=Hwangdonia sp. TaxID=1883432 RepID=UPI003AB61B54